MLVATHAADEAHALCDRVGVLHRGGLRCLAPPQRLLATYGGSYRLDLTSDAPAGDLDAFVDAAFEKKARFDSALGGTRTYLVPMHAVVLSKAFKALERDGDKLRLSDYALTQPSLESVFLDLSGLETWERAGDAPDTAAPRGNSAGDDLERPDRDAAVAKRGSFPGHPLPSGAA